MRPPASTTAMVWAAASRRDHVRATCLSGGAMGLMVPRSGQVPTSDRDAGLAQAAYGLGQVAHRLRRGHRVGDVVGADEDDGQVGAGGQGGCRPGPSGGWTARRPPRARAGARAGRPGRPRRWPGGRRGCPRPARRRSRPRWSRRAARCGSPGRGGPGRTSRSRPAAGPRSGSRWRGAPAWPRRPARRTARRRARRGHRRRTRRRRRACVRRLRFPRLHVTHG